MRDPAAQWEDWGRGVFVFWRVGARGGVLGLEAPGDHGLEGLGTHWLEASVTVISRVL